jgi:hypothetical protein
MWAAFNAPVGYRIILAYGLQFLRYALAARSTAVAVSFHSSADLRLRLSRARKEEARKIAALASSAQKCVQPFTTDDNLRADAGGFYSMRRNQVSQFARRTGQIGGCFKHRHNDRRRGADLIRPFNRQAVTDFGFHHGAKLHRDESEQQNFPCEISSEISHATPIPSADSLPDSFGIGCVTAFLAASDYLVNCHAREIVFAEDVVEYVGVQTGIKHHQREHARDKFPAFEETKNSVGIFLTDYQ